MNVSKAEYKMLNTMTNDLMEAECFINTIGVETRTGSAHDGFRNIKDIIKDINTVCSNNPTILDDAEKVIDEIKTSDDLEDFLSKYKIYN